MKRWLAAVLIAGALAPAVQAENAGGVEALESSMAGFYVVVATDVESGAPVAEVVKDEEGAEPRTVIVAFLDAEDAASEITAAGLGATAEGTLINAAELIDATGGEIIWRTSLANSSLANAARDRPPVFYITNAEGKPLTKAVDGNPKVIAFVDAEAADSARVAAENLLSAAGKGEKLSVVAAQLEGLIGGIWAGKVDNLYFASAPSVVRWGKQREEGARLLKDYKPE